MGTPEPTARVREADLDRHLSNPAEKAAAAEQAAKATTVADKKSADGKDEKKADKPARPDYGSKDDYQLNKVLTLLKGFQTVSR